MEEIKARVYLPHMSAEFAELVHQGTYLPNWCDFADEVYTREFAEKIPTLLRVVVDALPQEIPPALLALPPDAEVVLRETGSDTVVKAWLAITTLESTMQRQAKGFFTLSEAAEILSSSMRDQWGERMPAATMNKKMKLAFCKGALTFYDEYHEPIDLDNLKNMKEPGYDLHMLYTEGDKLGWYGETTSPKALNAWLESTGRPDRFPEPTTPPAPPVVAEPQATTPSPAPVVAAGASNAPATQGNIMKRAALIAALEYEWSSIEADINDATRNGLKAAAHTGKHGEWDKDKARAWAVSKGKIKQAAPVHCLAAVWSGTVTRNTIGDR